MYIKNYNKQQIYQDFLRHNMDFFKISFLLCTFIITTVGFLYTVGEGELFIKALEKISTIWEQSNKSNINENFIEKSLIELLIKLSIHLIGLLILLYIMSLPVQILGYFFISIILYFQKYGYGYKELLKQNITCLKNIILGRKKENQLNLNRKIIKK